MRRVGGKFTFSNVVAVLALFVALGGSAYAATQLPKNSVGAKQLKKGAVTPTKLSSKAKASLTGEAGPKGDPGAPGAPGIPGKDGAPATEFFAQVRPDGTVNASGSPVSVDHYGAGLYLVNTGSPKLPEEENTPPDFPSPTRFWSRPIGAHRNTTPPSTSRSSAESGRPAQRTEEDF